MDGAGCGCGRWASAAPPDDQVAGAPGRFRAACLRTGESHGGSGGGGARPVRCSGRSRAHLLHPGEPGRRRAGPAVHPRWRVCHGPVGHAGPRPGRPALCFRYLGVPEQDDRLDTPSMRDCVSTPLWTDPPPSTAGPPTWCAEPGISPTPRRRRGNRVRVTPCARGVGAELRLYPGTFHGSNMIASAESSRRMTADEVGALRRGLRVADRGLTTAGRCRQPLSSAAVRPSRTTRR